MVGDLILKVQGQEVGDDGKVAFREARSLRKALKCFLTLTFYSDYGGADWLNVGADANGWAGLQC